MRQAEMIVESAIVLCLSLASIFEVLPFAFTAHNYSLSLNDNAMMGAREVCINICEISLGMNFSDFWDPEAKRPCREVETRDTPGRMDGNSSSRELDNQDTHSLKLLNAED